MYIPIARPWISNRPPDGGRLHRSHMDPIHVGLPVRGRNTTIHRSGGMYFLSECTVSLQARPDVDCVSSQ